MTSPQIIRIPILPFRMVNAHLIRGPRGCILIDAGLPGSERKVGKVLSTQGLSFKDITLIVVTHAHVDHAGSAARIRQLSGAPIVGHTGDLAHFRRELPMTFCPTGWAGRLFLRAPLIYQPYREFTPDILLADDDVLDLSPYGIPGRIQHTPGHTAGSLSVALATQEVLVGDLIASGILIGGLVRIKHAIRPPFEESPRAVGIALQRLLDAGGENFYMGHGGPLTATAVRRHAQILMVMADPKRPSEYNRR